MLNLLLNLLHRLQLHLNYIFLKYFEEFNDVEIVEFEEAGHYPMIECPLLFASKIEFWVKNL